MLVRLREIYITLYMEQRGARFNYVYNWLIQRYRLQIICTPIEVNWNQPVLISDYRSVLHLIYFLPSRCIYSQHTGMMRIRNNNDNCHA